MIIVIILLSLLGCSNKNSANYYPDCNNHPVCTVAIVSTAIYIESTRSRSCKDMPKKHKEECAAQVESLKTSIKRAQQKPNYQ